MFNVAYIIVTYLLLLTAVRCTSVQPKQIISVNEVNRTLDPSCWRNRTESQYSSVEVALDGVELHNSTLVVVKYECESKDLQESAAAHDALCHPLCPTWFFPNTSLNGTCTCGDDVNDIVKCDESTREISMLDCYCMTYSNSTGPVVGACFYICGNHLIDELYNLLASNVTELNTYMCGHLNREGQLCGKCKENNSIPVYSYDMKCVQCLTSPLNWVKYILAAFLPLTVFFGFHCELQAQCYFTKTTCICLL